jgi:hypothetical protein
LLYFVDDAPPSTEGKTHSKVEAANAFTVTNVQSISTALLKIQQIL